MGEGRGERGEGRRERGEGRGEREEGRGEAQTYNILRSGNLMVKSEGGSHKIKDSPLVESVPVIFL
jgi:hypothetical protein